MSQDAVVWALEQDIPDPVAKLLLVAIARFADNHNLTAWPGQAKLAKIIGRSLDTVQRKLTNAVAGAPSVGASRSSR